MWVKIDDKLHSHPKVGGLPQLALGLHLLALSYCGDQLTDGLVPRWWAERVCESAAQIDALVGAGVWEAADGGWLIHDFLDFNPCREEVLSEREHGRRRNALSRDRDLIAAIRERDGNLCRYCGMEVDWTDRRGAKGGTYDHVVARGPNSLENIVVACRRCNSTKGARPLATCGLALLPPPGARSELDQTQLRSEDPTRPESTTTATGTTDGAGRVRARGDAPSRPDH